MVTERNRYARQELANTPERLARFREVTRAELKAFIAINIIMGIVKLANLALYWSTDDLFANHGINKTMAMGRFVEISCYLHFSDSSWEPARGDANYDRRRIENLSNEPENSGKHFIVKIDGRKKEVCLTFLNCLAIP